MFKGMEVLVLVGSYKGQVGTVIEVDYDDEAGEQYSIQMSDGSVRYLDNEDIEEVKGKAR